MYIKRKKDTEIKEIEREIKRTKDVKSKREKEREIKRKKE